MLPSDIHTRVSFSFAASPSRPPPAMTEFWELTPSAFELSLCWSKDVAICCPVYIRKASVYMCIHSMYCMLLCTVTASSVHFLFVFILCFEIVASCFLPLGNLCLFFNIMETFHFPMRRASYPPPVSTKLLHISQGQHPVIPKYLLI